MNGGPLLSRVPYPFSLLLYPPSLPQFLRSQYISWPPSTSVKMGFAGLVLRHLTARIISGQPREGPNGLRQGLGRASTVQGARKTARDEGWPLCRSGEACCMDFYRSEPAKRSRTLLEMPTAVNLEARDPSRAAFGCEHLAIILY